MADTNIHEKTIKAKEFAKKCISDEIKELSNEEYALLQISKFILLKEKIIQKDSQGNLHFNYNRYHEYIDAIKDISKTLTANSKVKDIKRKLTVLIEPPQFSDNKELEEHILLTHKLRDALAHGNSDIDLKNKNIIVKNDTEDMHLETTIPISLLERFTLVKAKLNINDVPIFINKYQFNNQVVDNDTYNNKKYKEDFKIYPIDKDINNNELNVQYDNFNEEYTYERIIQLEILKALFHYAHNFGFSNKKIDEIAQSLQVIDFKVTDNSVFIYKIDNIIKEMANIMELQSKNPNPYAVVGVYNYMQIFFSNYYNHIWNNRPACLPHIKTSKIAPIFSKNPAVYQKISDYVKLAVKRTRKALNNYYLISNPEYKEKILNDIKISCDRIINEILRLFGIKNMEIITGIRNSIEHGNIKDFGDAILLYDKEDQRDRGYINFMAMATCKDYFELTKMLDEDKYIPLTIEEILEELRHIIESSLVRELEQVLNEVNGLLNQKRI